MERELGRLQKMVWYVHYLSFLTPAPMACISSVLGMLAIVQRWCLEALEEGLLCYVSRA